MPAAAPAPATLPYPVTVPIVGEKKRYRLRVKENAPFYGADVAGHAFHTESTQIVPDPRNPGKWMARQTDGLIEFLTAEQIAEIRAKIPTKFVRVIKTLDGKHVSAEIFEPHGPQGPDDKRVSVPMNRATDTPLGDYIEIEELD